MDIDVEVKGGISDIHNFLPIIQDKLKKNHSFLISDTAELC